MKCKCDKEIELNGQEANAYAKNHLQEVHVNGENWEIKYECPDTGSVWIMDFPHGELHGGGPPRLRNLSDPD
jgi:hypothetical protein